MLIIVTYVSSEFYADSKKIGCLFFGHLKVIFRPLEFMTPRSLLFIYLLISNTCLTSRLTQENDRNCVGNIIKLKKMKSHFETSRRSFQGQLLLSFQIYIIARIYNSPWIGDHTPPPPTTHPHQLFLSFDMSKT